MELTSSCLCWSAARSKAGYGVFRLDGKNVLAHRLAYCDANGLVPADIKGLEVRHKCDNPPCFNPDHLEIGTHGDNMRDASRRGRMKKSPEQRARMSAGQRARGPRGPMSAEHRAKIAAAGIGRRPSEETRQRLRDAWVLRKQIGASNARE